MTKNIDAVEMKRRGAEHVRQLTKGMTREQLLDFWARRTRDLEEEQRRAREASRKRIA